MRLANGAIAVARLMPYYPTARRQAPVAANGISRAQATLEWAVFLSHLRTAEE